MKSLFFNCLLLLSALDASKLTQYLNQQITNSSPDKYHDILVQLTPVEINDYKCRKAGSYEELANAKARWVLGKVQLHANETQELILPTIRRLETEKDITYFEPFFVTNTLSVKANAKAILQLEELEVVKEISSNGLIKAELGNVKPCSSHLKKREDTPYYDNWHVQFIKVTRKTAQFIANTTKLTIGFPDTGVDFKHDALRSTYRGLQEDGSYNHDYNWFDTVTSDDSLYPNKKCPPNMSEPCDDTGHGTMVSSIAVGTNVNSVNPQSQWIACRNMNQEYSRLSMYLRCLQFMFAPTRRDGTEYRVDLRPHVVNHSYGCDASEGCSKTSFDLAIRALKYAGIMSVKSAGNSGSNSCGTIVTEPASAPDIVNVGGLAYNSKQRFSSSSVGPIQGRSVSINLVAPGDRVTVAEYDTESSYSTWSGTSLAAPQVAAAALMVMQACPSYFRKVDKTMKLLEETATPLYSTLGCGGDSSQSIPNNEYGYGLLNVEKALEKCLKESGKRL